jgi:hypothetical protein
MHKPRRWQVRCSYEVVAALGALRSCRFRQVGPQACVDWLISGACGLDSKDSFGGLQPRG